LDTLRRITASTCAAALGIPAIVAAAVVLPATPAEATHYGMPDWWVMSGYGQENNSRYPAAEFDVCLMTYGGSVPITVDYATSDGTATAGADYVATSGTLIFLPVAGQHCQTVDVPILDDNLYEPGDESDDVWFWGEWFHFDLSNPGVGAPQIDEYGHTYGTIEDDLDDWPAHIVTDDTTVAEGGTTNVPVRLDMAKKYPITVHWETVSESATGVDFVVASGDATFEPGELRTYVSIPTRQDALNEPSETFTVVLSNSQPADRTTIWRASSHTITDDDPLPRISVRDVVVKGARPAKAKFVVTLSAASGRPVEVDYSTHDGSARYPQYRPMSGTLAFPPGTTTRTVTVPLSAQHFAAGAQRTFSLGVIAPVNAGLGRDVGVARVRCVPTRRARHC
jgi:hypothetical protein